MKNFFDKIFKDKRILVIYILVIILIIAGVTYALNISSLNLAGTTAVIGIDEDAYGETSIDTSNIDLRPILDNKVETSLENVIKIDFLVGGNINNTTDEVIYDIALVDLDMDDELSSPYVKWKLVKNGKNISFYDDFSDVSSGDRVVLTTEQQDLVPYNEDKSLYDSYTFYLWLSDSCQKSIGSCTNYADQSNLLNKHISGKIEVELYTGSKNGQGNGNVKEGVLLSEHIEALYNDGSTITETTVGDGPQIVSLNNVQRIMKVDQGSTYGVEYRYYGNDTVEDAANGKYLTKNYVDFNGELWRIISVSKVFSSEEDTVGETRVRIIKDTPIGDYAWDSDDDYNNNWADATLMCQLNTMYYNDTVPACEGKSLDSLDTSLNAEAKSLIDNALWYLGGGDTSEIYADDYYTMERGTAVADSSYPYRWTGKIGLMYPSDYAYATDLSQCTKTGEIYDTDTTNCLNTDWLFNEEDQWLMSPNSDAFHYAWGVYEDGGIIGGGDVDREYGVRPLAVLKSDVTKLEGEGTSGNPYRLGLGT